LTVTRGSLKKPSPRQVSEKVDECHDNFSIDELLEFDAAAEERNRNVSSWIYGCQPIIDASFCQLDFQYPWSDMAFFKAQFFV
jgi:hypothetical protein